MAGLRIPFEEAYNGSLNRVPMVNPILPQAKRMVVKNSFAYGATVGALERFVTIFVSKE